MKRCSDFQDHGVFLSGLNRVFCGCLSFFCFGMKGQPLITKQTVLLYSSHRWAVDICWLLNGNSNSCWLFSSVFWSWILRRATYDLKTISRIGSKDDADDNWLGSYLVCVFPLDRTKYILYHGKKNEHYSFHSFKSFQSEPTIPNGFLACFHVVPRVLLWFCK